MNYRMKKIFLYFALLITLQTWGQNGIEVVNIENSAVREYMADAERIYTSNNNYSYSIVSQYNNVNKYGKKLHWPNGKEVNWTCTVPVEEIAEIRITLTDNENNVYKYNPSEKTSCSYVVRNLIPDRVYKYVVEERLKDGTVNTLNQGRFRTEGQVRMIQVANCGNVRDIGGWPSQYGGRVKYGRLYRSGSLNRITPEGRQAFVENMGVVAELDLRYEVKQENTTLGKGEGFFYDRRPHEAGVKGLTQCQADYVKDLRWILDKLRNDKNVDWHCAIGCDRCGTVSFLIEGLLGLSELDLSRDFELSTFSLASNNKRPRGHIKSMLDYIKRNAPSLDTTDPQYLAKCFKKYWLDIGMYPEELDEFIGIMVETDHDYQNAKLIHGDYSEFELEPEQPTKSYMEFPVN
jgi:protein-tyrosine phosphatase